MNIELYINNFEELFQFSTTDDGDLSGFAINDFDQDGKTELIFGSGRHGNIYVIENIGNNEYSLINQFTFPTPNAYMVATTSDIDGNGKPEFWIGGQNFEEGITVYQSYESDCDNSYKPITRIELRYSTSFGANYIQAVDIDHCGKEELVISSGNIILILKFVGSPNHHLYKLWYAKIGEETQPGAEFYPAAIADLDGDKKKDILIPFRKYRYPITYAFSYIIRQDTITNVEPILQQNKDTFISSFPTPFNSTSTIIFQIDQTKDVRIKVFNSIGKEINTLLDKELLSGKYQLVWEGKDKYGRSLPSGVYYIVLQTDQFTKTTKTILLK